VPVLRPTHWRVQERIFEAAGFAFSHQEGDHRIYKKPGAARPVVIKQVRDVPVAEIMSNMRSAGMSRQRYFELLERVR
jgi:predicted RNA binding protein YcfA (HicA-like mRNA interferase family)